MDACDTGSLISDRRVPEARADSGVPWASEVAGPGTTGGIAYVMHGNDGYEFKTRGGRHWVRLFIHAIVMHVTDQDRQ